jgi:DNA-directed RNA polymerase subunit K/omega
MSYFPDEDDNYSEDGHLDEEEEEEEYIPSQSGLNRNNKKKTNLLNDDQDEDEDEEPLDEDEDVVDEPGDEDEEQLDEDEDVVDDDDDDDVDNDDEELEGEQEELEESEPKKMKKLPQNIVYNEEEDDDDDDGEMYLKKFDKDIHKNYIMNFHPECVMHNYDEIESLSKVVRDQNGVVIDDLHRTLPYLTKYERTRILGQRAKQINSGATPFVKVPENVIDGYLVAELELKQKRIPFIIRRPLPNGGSEYWNIKDLENISF